MKSNKRKDAKMNTIQDDPEYKAFLEFLEERDKPYHFTLDTRLDEIEAKNKEKRERERVHLEI